MDNDDLLDEWDDWCVGGRLPTMDMQENVQDGNLRGADRLTQDWLDGGLAWQRRLETSARIERRRPRRFVDVRTERCLACGILLCANANGDDGAIKGHKCPAGMPETRQMKACVFHGYRRKDCMDSDCYTWQDYQGLL